MKWISIITFYLIFGREGWWIILRRLSFPLETVLPFCDVMKQSMFILAMTSIVCRFLSTSYSEYLIFIQTYILKLSILLDHFNCYFLDLFLKANFLFFYSYRLLDFLNSSVNKRIHRRRTLPLVCTHIPIGMPMESFSECFVLFKVVEGWFQLGGCSPVWFLRHDDLEYVWHKIE